MILVLTRTIQLSPESVVYYNFDPRFF